MVGDGVVIDDGDAGLSAGHTCNDAVTADARKTSRHSLNGVSD